jgi:hypothetical protein
MTSSILGSHCSLTVVIFGCQMIKGGIHECNNVSVSLIYFFMLLHTIMHIQILELIISLRFLPGHFVFLHFIVFFVTLKIG